MSFVLFLVIFLVSSVYTQMTCVLEHCALQLAECEANTICRVWSNCCRNCNVSDTACQIRCGDLYEPTNSSSDKITEFSICTISEHHCIARVNATCQKPYIGSLVKSFDIKVDLIGKWYITRGFNTLFDCFDCQVHNFSYDSRPSVSKPLIGDLKWNVKKNLSCTENCEYFSREVLQTFSQDVHLPGHLMNYNNSIAEMHYSDDWYILYASNKAVLVYYCGCNDASCGYGGAVLYSRTPQLPQEEEIGLKIAVETANIPNFTFDGMCIPKNTFC